MDATIFKTSCKISKLCAYQNVRSKVAFKLRGSDNKSCVNQCNGMFHTFKFIILNKLQYCAISIPINSRKTTCTESRLSCTCTAMAISNRRVNSCTRV